MKNNSLAAGAVASFTLLYVLAAFGVWIGLGCVAWHFIAKFW